MEIPKGVKKVASSIHDVVDERDTWEESRGQVEDIIVECLGIELVVELCAEVLKTASREWHPELGRAIYLAHMIQKKLKGE